MGTPFEDFDDVEDNEPSGEFKLGGRVWHIRNQNDVPFETVRRLMGQTPVEEDASDSEKAEAAKEVVLQTGPFFASTVVRDEVDAFMEMLSEDDSPLTIGKLRPVMEYVSRVVFSEPGEELRPTKPSATKPRGRSGTGSTSKGSSSSRGTRSRAS